jgi:hypothetical protein
MNKIGSTEWYTLKPKHHDYDYCGVSDWTQTLATKINQCGATLFQKRANDENIEVVIRKLFVPTSFRSQFEMLGYYNPSTKNLAGRFDVEFEDRESILVVENDNYCEIILIHEPFVSK